MLTPSGAQGVRMSVCLRPAQNDESFSLRSLSGQALNKIGSRPGNKYADGASSLVVLYFLGLQDRRDAEYQ